MAGEVEVGEVEEVDGGNGPPWKPELSSAISNFIDLQITEVANTRVHPR